MSFNYKHLWKLLIDKNMNKETLKRKINASPSTIARMSKNKTVSMETLGKICEILQCNINDIVEYTKEENESV